MLFENVPQNVKHAAGPALEFEIGTLRAGETRELELVLTAEKAGKVVNVLTARADGNLQVQQQVEFEVIAPALDGRRRRSGTPLPRTAGNVRSQRRKSGHRARARRADRHQAAQGHAVRPREQHGRIRCGHARRVLEPGRAAEGRDAARSSWSRCRSKPARKRSQVESHAQQGLTDQTQREIVVEGLAAIMFEVRDLEDPIEVGGETGYEIRVVNQGTKAATNVQVAVNLPPGMKVVSAEGETQHNDPRRPAGLRAARSNSRRRPTRSTAFAPKACRPATSGSRSKSTPTTSDNPSAAKKARACSAMNSRRRVAPKLALHVTNPHQPAQVRLHALGQHRRVVTAFQHADDAPARRERPQHRARACVSSAKSSISKPERADRVGAMAVEARADEHKLRPDAGGELFQLARESLAIRRRAACRT